MNILLRPNRHTVVVRTCSHAMSLYRWLNDREKSDSPLLLVAGDAATSAANKEVEQEMASTLPSRILRTLQ